MAKNKKGIFNIKKIIPYDFIWTKEKPLSFITEEYQKFLVNLEYVNVDKKYKTIQVTSSISGEGKSTFLSNIAYLLSQKNKKVILIDLDLRKPKVHRIFKIRNSDGITDVLAEKISLKESIKTNKTLGFDIINSGTKTDAIINLLESKKIVKIVNELKELYDYVLIDSPPVINVSDALYISNFSDAVLFIVSKNKTKRVLIKEAVKLLRQNNINVIGIVLTQMNMKKTRYGYSYGYSYKYEE